MPLHCGKVPIEHFFYLYTCLPCTLNTTLNKYVDAANLVEKFKVHSPVLRGSYIHPSTRTPKCYAPINAASNEQTLGHWLSLVSQNKLNIGCQVIFVTQTALSILKDQFFANIPKPEAFLGSDKRLKRLGKNFESFANKKLAFANELPGHNATKLVSLVHTNLDCQTSHFAVEMLSKWNDTAKAFVTSKMGIKNPRNLELRLKGVNQFAKPPTALAQLRSNFEGHYRPSFNLCVHIANLSWTKQFYPSFRIDQCVQNMIMRTR